MANQPETPRPAGMDYKFNKIPQLLVLRLDSRERRCSSFALIQPRLSREHDSTGPSYQPDRVRTSEASMTKRIIAPSLFGVLLCHNHNIQKRSV